MHRFTLSVTAVCAVALLLAAAPPASAQTDVDRWDEPMAAEPVLSLPGGGAVEGDTLHLPAGRQVELQVRALDQRGRPFPQERFRFELDFDRACDNLVELVSASEGVITLQTADRAGDCSLLFWVPNNMNLDRRYRVSVGRGTGSGLATRPATAEIDTREELVAASLFRAVLGREPDAEWLAAAADEVRRNRTRNQAQALLASPEFAERRQTVPPEALLRDVYRGLLGRDLDVSGSRTYLADVRQGELEDVLLSILTSEEFRERIDREID